MDVTGRPGSQSTETSFRNELMQAQELTDASPI